jgi:hypothetical protein
MCTAGQAERSVLRTFSITNTVEQNSAGMVFDSAQRKAEPVENSQNGKQITPNQGMDPTLTDAI